MEHRNFLKIVDIFVEMLYNMRRQIIKGGIYMKNIRKIILMILVFVSLITSVSLIDVKAMTAPTSVTLKSKSDLYKLIENFE